MPFGNGKGMPLDKLVGGHLRQGRVSNAFRQRQGNADDVYEVTVAAEMALSPMPFGNGKGMPSGFVTRSV